MNLMESPNSKVLVQLFNTLGHYCMNGLYGNLREILVDLGYLVPVLQRIHPE